MIRSNFQEGGIGLRIDFLLGTVGDTLILILGFLKLPLGPMRVVADGIGGRAGKNGNGFLKDFQRPGARGEDSLLFAKICRVSGPTTTV